MAEKTFLQAIRDAQYEEMKRDKGVFVMGEDVECNMFGTTTGMIQDFGKERVRDTPIAEAGMAGVAAGAAMVGMRPIVDFTIAPFLYPAMDQIISIIAKSRFLYGGQAKVPVVLRANMIYGNGNAAQHSDRPYSMFMHMPGLKIMVPSSAYDMKGLMKSAIRDDNPTLFLEHKALYRRIKEHVSEDPAALVPISSAAVKRPGDDVTIVTYGAMVHKALEAADTLAGRGISAEVVDLRTVYPIDEETVIRSIEKTSRALVLYESFHFLGIGAEVASVIAEKAFEHLDAPVMRLAPPNHPVPFSPPLEDAFLPQVADIEAAVDRLSAW